jgi:LDH2 family malate/lactate/ureidoglycolate dehydrogenase
VEKGRINPGAKPAIIHETQTTATLDADGGLGLWTAHIAMQIAMEKALQFGTGWVAVRNSSHFGIAGAHSMMALEKDMIGWAMTNASPLVSPAGARKAFFGTNPISVAIPSGNKPHFVLDMATSAAANGKLEIAQRKGNPIPNGWAQDKDGQSTTDAFALSKGGTLLPLGSNSELGYHKGSGLGALVDILTGVLPGANFGHWVPPFVAFLDPLPDQPGKGIGHFLGAMRVDAFQPTEEFKKKMDLWIETYESLPTAKGVDKVLIPGEPEAILHEQRLKEGIPINDKVMEDLRKLGWEF